VEQASVVGNSLGRYQLAERLGPRWKCPRKVVSFSYATAVECHMTYDPKDYFEECLIHKRAGGVGLDVQASSAVWMGGISDAWEHERFVAVGSEGFRSPNKVHPCMLDGRR
jgi:hypothetical protein